MMRCNTLLPVGPCVAPVLRSGTAAARAHVHNFLNHIIVTSLSLYIYIYIIECVYIYIYIHMYIYTQIHIYTLYVYLFNLHIF